MIPAKVPDGDPIALARDDSDAPTERDWLTALGSTGPDRDVALRDLHRLLVGAARHQVWRMRGLLPALGAESLEDLAHCAADDALTILLGKIGTFQGRSRFTTWAYKFALYQASVKVRRRAWQGREIPVEDEAWSVLSSAGLEPDQEAEQSELLAAIQTGIAQALTPHQRRVLVALALNGVPIDVLAERLQTTRGALYKSLHDARRKLRAYLADAGHAVGEPLEEVS